MRADTVLAPLVDAASGARPGARCEVLESYVRRREDLEYISSSFHGVEESFAVQAGSEIRILGEHAQVSDEEAATLGSRGCSVDRGEFASPGPIGVTVICALRARGFAR